MKFVHRILKTILPFPLLFVLIAGPTLTLTASGRQLKNQRDRADKRVRSDAAIRGDRAAKKIQPALKSVRSNSSTKRQRVAELRRNEARRRAEATRLAAIARQRAIDDSMRAEVQSMIGRDNTVGEDLEIRRVAVTALGQHAGTVVVMDPMTGRVYSIINQEWAVRRGFKPCSTIKLVTGLAGLNENVIDPIDSANISDTNRMDLTKALAYSNNPYFQEVGGRVGFAKMISYARRLGLGEKTGINAPYETQGQVPAPRTGYAVNHMSSHGDDFKVTAVQLATLVSAMANGGKLLSPRVPRTLQEQAKFKPGVRRTINMNLDSLRYMVPGMVGAVNYGSGRRARDSQETVAGKTGTCIENGTWVGLFASYAPLRNPRLAVVVIARGADARSHFPAAVAGRIYRELNGRFGTPTDLQVAAARTGGNAASVRDPKAVLAEAEGEESDDEGIENAVVKTTLATISSANGLETAMSTVAAVSGTKASPQPLLRNTNSSVNSNTRRVFMSIPNGSTESRESKVGSKPAPKIAPPLQTRPRRVSDTGQ